MLLQETLNIDLNDEQFFSGNFLGQSKENTKPIIFPDKSAAEIITLVTDRIKALLRS